VEVRFLDARRVWTHKLSDHRITEATYSGDGRLILAGDSAGRVYILDAETKKEIFPTMATEFSEVVLLRWLEEPQMVLCVSGDHHISVWDPRQSSMVTQHYLITPMKTAMFVDGNSLLFSSFAKDSGVCWLEIDELLKKGPLKIWRIAHTHFRVQTLRPLGKGQIGCILEDNSAVVVDRETGGVAEWKLSIQTSKEAKIMDFIFDFGSQTVVVCGEGFVQSFPWTSPPISKGNGPQLVTDPESQAPRYNTTFESLDSLKLDASALPDE
jgi:WD40 repeat protein